MVQGGMRAWRGIFAIAFSWWLLALPAAAAEPLKLGVLPYNSTLALLKIYAPLRDHLSSRLNRPVDIVSSADYFTFINESLDGQFDLLVTAPHFGVMSIERGYVPLRRFKATLESRLVVAQEAPITKAADLRGKRIGFASRLAIIPIGSVRWLRDAGLELGRDYRVVEYPTHAAALAAVAVGDVDAAFVSGTMIPQTPADIRVRVKVLSTDIRLPHLITLGHPRLGKRTLDAVRAALDDFPATLAGQAFFANTGFAGYAPLTPADLAALKPYVDITRTMLSHRP